MNSRITLLIMLISLILLIFIASYGIEIGEFKILSISKLIEKNDNLYEKIEEANELVAMDYPKELQELEETFESYQIQKQKYEELAGVTSEIGKEIYETKQYDISYLWRVLGKYAQKRGLTLGIDVKKDAAHESSYTFNFNVTGKYVDISQFITDLENDSDLYFRIYNFRMNSSNNGQTIQSTFTVRNINIDSSTIS